jgi:phenylpropionate dioxygenase-like ring-hydroxylating dioxygenase large terminal subunit
MKRDLGKIKKVNLRGVFPDEARDFTPWLKDNIDQLSEAIGIEIIDLRREGDVGGFSCDLIGTEANSEDKIIIENQFSQTNHDHLGKIITYASGVGAKYVVWISEKIREEHQKALEWLNENANDISFFGIEVSAISIDESSPALNFKSVIEPNAWGKEVKKATEQIDERHQKYLKFFNRLVTEYEKIKPEWRHLTARPDSWTGFGAGKTGFNFIWAFRGDNRFDVELYIDTKDKEEVKAYFAELRQYQKEINSQIKDLSWEELPSRRGSRIAVYKKMPEPIKKLSDNQIDGIIKWAIVQMDVFKKVFPHYINKLEK